MNCGYIIMSVIFQVTEDEKVSTVKELVSERLNIPANQQRLLYKGKALAGRLANHQMCFITLVCNCCSIHPSSTLIYRYSVSWSCCVLRFLDEHRLSDYSIGPEAKLNLVIRPSGERTGASGTAGSSAQGGVWQTVSTILARHFSPADAAKVHEQLIKVF